MLTRSQTKLSITPVAKASRKVVTKSMPKSSITSPSSPVTRSQTKSKQEFDFDESSSAWLSNKTKLGNGMYSYKPSATGITTRSGLILSA